MVNAIARNTALIVALVCGATLCALTAGWMTSPRGGIGPVALQAEHPVAAVLAVLLSLVIAAVAAVVVGRIWNTAVGMFVAGGAIFGLAWRTDTIREFVHFGSLPMAAIETALLAILILGLTILVFRFSGPLRDVEPDEEGRRPHPLLSADAWRAAACAALMVPAVWLVAQSPMKGQVLGAAFVGGVVTGMAGRLWSPHVQPVLVFSAAVLFGGVGHMIGWFLVDAELPEAYVLSLLKAVSLPMPIDYASGALMGVAVGLGIAKSYLHQEEEGA